MTHIAIIGGGPGGYEAAIYAAKRGAQVTLVEENRLGGTCLNVGCIPTKALLAASDTMHAISEAAAYGITAAAATADYKAVVARKNQVVDELVQGVEYLLQAQQVTILHGHAELTAEKSVRVNLVEGGQQVLRPDAVILATGSQPTQPKFLPIDGQRVITSNDFLALQEMPKSMIIVGGGVIGVEIGQFLARLGTEITIVEMQPHLLPNEDPDVSKAVEKRFRKERIKVLCGKGIAEVLPEEGDVAAKLSDGAVIHAEKILVAIGRSPRTRDLGLETAGVKVTEQGFVEVDESMRTSVPGIYAIGDIVPTPQLAHVAGKEGCTAVDTILGDEKKMAYHAVPRCVYTYPETAVVGITATELQRMEKPYRVGRFDFSASGKAKAIGKTDGFVKVITDENDVLIGAAVVGAHATELIQPLTLAIEWRVTAQQAGNVIYPHPTMCEAIMEALHDVHGLSIHKP